MAGAPPDRGRPLPELRMIALDGVPQIGPGDDLGAIIADRARAQDLTLRDDDILIVAQKVVSKAENRFRDLAGIVPGAQAHELARVCGKDPRKVQAVLDESTEVVRVAGNGTTGVLITRHRQGWVMANAGIDESNLGQEGRILLLPEDPDASAEGIAARLASLSGARPGVIVTDTFGRPWRHGLVNVAIGVSGVAPIVDWIGTPDAYGRTLDVTQQALADEIATAAGLLMPKDRATPVVVLRGLTWTRNPHAGARRYVRAQKEDLFK